MRHFKPVKKVIEVDNILRIHDVTARCGLSKTTVYLLTTRGQFPTPIRLTERAIGWPESEITAWLEQRRSLGYVPVTPSKAAVDRMVAARRARSETSDVIND